ncbi:transposase [bacterium]|nr:transposase [bacterium]
MSLPKRKVLRIQGYNYSNTGVYFITICTQNRKELLGNIHNAIMNKSECGKYVEYCINKIAEKYPFINVDTYVVMPNHVHLLLSINEKFYDKNTLAQRTLPKVIQQFKSNSKKLYNIFGQHFGQRDTLPLQWQRNYYEHIVRNEKEYLEIYNYIENNPLAWELDTYYKNGID